MMSNINNELELYNDWVDIFLKLTINNIPCVDYIKQIFSKLENMKYFPQKNLIFNAFNLCSFNNLKVVIIGQDPYILENQANGLAFSVENNIKIPPSLNNIFKCVKNSYPDFKIPKNGNLINWAKQGVLLLNCILTVSPGKSKSHDKIGWVEFTDCIIDYIDNNKKNVIFVLWGNDAIKKKNIINNSIILESNHPSPLANPIKFISNNHFYIINDILKKNNLSEINWNL